MTFNDKTPHQLDVDDLPTLSELKNEEISVKANAPVTVVRRLPRYYRFLRDMLNHDILRTSSTELSKLMGVTASQIRQDLNYFGEFGQQGYGYNVKHLYMQISRILGVGSKFTAVTVGTHEFCTAFNENRMFEMRGVRVRGSFNVSCSEDLSSLANFCRDNEIDIAVINVSEQLIDETADAVINAGVKGIWNFSNLEIRSKELAVQNMCPGDSLMMLTYELNEKGKAAE